MIGAFSTHLRNHMGVRVNVGTETEPVYEIWRPMDGNVKLVVVDDRHNAHPICLALWTAVHLRYPLHKTYDGFNLIRTGTRTPTGEEFGRTDDEAIIYKTTYDSKDANIREHLLNEKIDFRCL